MCKRGDRRAKKPEKKYSLLDLLYTVKTGNLTTVFTYGQLQNLVCIFLLTPSRKSFPCVTPIAITTYVINANQSTYIIENKTQGCVMKRSFSTKLIEQSLNRWIKINKK